MKNKPRQVIMEVCKWISETEGMKLYSDNILTSICATLNNDPSNSKIQRLQYNIPHLHTRIADLTDKIGVGYFDFDSHIPHSPGQNKKPTLQKLQPPLEQEEEGPT